MQRGMKKLEAGKKREHSARIEGGPTGLSGCSRQEQSGRIGQ